jgi:hypothetical protein
MRSNQGRENDSDYTDADFHGLKQYHKFPPHGNPRDCYRGPWLISAARGSGANQLYRRMNENNRISVYHSWRAMNAQVSTPNLDGDPATSAPAIAAAAFHGVTLGGTLAAPTLTNNTDKALYGYVLNVHSVTTPYHVPKPNVKVTGPDDFILTTDYTHTHWVFSSDRIAYTGGIKPGETQSVGGMVLGVVTGIVDPVTKELVMEGTKDSMTLKGVLFEDGTFFGDDIGFERLSSMVYLYRSYARDLQYRENREEVLRQDLHPRARLASEDPRRGLTSSLASVFLAVRNRKNDPEEMNKSIARIANIPDVVKGQ